MLSLNYKFPIGIDIADNHIYAVQFKKTREGLMVRGLVHREFDKGSKEFFEASDVFISVLKEIVKNKRFHGKKVVIKFPSKYVFSFPISFEVTSERTLEDAILQEAKNYLSFPIEEAVIDYPSIQPLSSDDPNKYKAIVIAVQRDQMEQYLSILKQAGMIVEAIDFALSSLVRIHNYLYSIDNNPIILCNIGQKQSLLSTITKDIIYAHRNVGWGIQTLVNKIRTNLEISGDDKQVKAMLKKYGLFYEDYINSKDKKAGENDDNMTIGTYRAIYQILSPYIDELIYEIHQIIGYVRSDQQITAFEGVYIYGEAPFIHFMDHYLEKRLNIPTHIINPMTKVALADKRILIELTEGAPFALAMGLAMRKVKWL